MSIELKVTLHSMKFGKVDHPELIDFTLPPDRIETTQILSQYEAKKYPEIYIGCATWSKSALKGFYPKGTKDELTYYSTQFNSIEFNASYYRIFPREQFEKWQSKVESDFKFFPKLYQGISHWKRLKETETYIDEYIDAVSGLEDHLSSCFLQMHNNFAPNQDSLQALEQFISYWPNAYELSIELRHTDWYNLPDISDYIFRLFEDYGINSIITDSAGRRDVLHMRLTTPNAFIRYVGTNHPTDYDRVIDWGNRIIDWTKQGLQKLYFFVHQENEIETVNISRHLIEYLNQQLGCDLKIPELVNS